MEKIDKTLTQLASQLEERKKENTLCSQYDTSCSINTTSHNVEKHNVYEMIPKKDYAILLNQLDAWNVGSPKAVCRIYGVKTVQRAVAYVKGTPNVRNNGAYFTYMVRQLKSEQPVKPEEIPAVVKENLTVQNPAPQSPTSPVKIKKGIFTPPNIINWQQARNFLANLTDNDLEDEDVVIFANKLKKTYNFA